MPIISFQFTHEHFEAQQALEVAQATQHLISWWMTTTLMDNPIEGG